MSTRHEAPDGDGVSPEVLALLREFRDTPHSQLTDTVRKMTGEETKKVRTDKALRLLDDLERGLSERLDRPVHLYVTTPKRGTRSTPECKQLSQAVEHVWGAREQAEKAAKRQRELQWLQLASSLDDRRLVIGAYQAHIERFLGRAMQELHAEFPWIQAELKMYPNRERGPDGKGDLKREFDAEAVDYMLEPGDRQDSRYSQTGRECYSYSLRVVGSPAKLRQVHGDEAERLHVDQVKTLRVDKLQGHTLIAAPRGFSSRDRLHDLLGRVPVGTVLDEPNPLLLRVRALAGEALAVLSDEYTAVGRPRFSYPIILSANNTRHCVPMYLRGHPGPTWGVHAAFLYVVEHLVEEEKKHPRAAALD